MATFSSPAVRLKKPVSVSEEKVSDGLPAEPAGTVTVPPAVTAPVTRLPAVPLKTSFEFVALVRNVNASALSS